MINNRTTYLYFGALTVDDFDRVSEAMDEQIQEVEPAPFRRMEEAQRYAKSLAHHQSGAKARSRSRKENDNTS